MRQYFVLSASVTTIFGFRLRMYGEKSKYQNKISDIFQVSLIFN